MTMSQPWRKVSLAISVAHRQEDEKRKRYLTLCTARNIVFFTFGMDAMGRLSSEHFLRWLAICLPGTDCERGKFFQYWLRRIVMSTLKRQMTHLIAQQEDRSPRYTRVVEEASRLDTCMRTCQVEICVG